VYIIRMKTVRQLTSQVSKLNETVTVYRLVKVNQKKYLFIILNRKYYIFNCL